MAEVFHRNVGGDTVPEELKDTRQAGAKSPLTLIRCFLVPIAIPAMSVSANLGK